MAGAQESVDVGHDDERRRVADDGSSSPYTGP